MMPLFISVSGILNGAAFFVELDLPFYMVLMIPGFLLTMTLLPSGQTIAADLTKRLAPDNGEGCCFKVKCDIADFNVDTDIVCVDDKEEESTVWDDDEEEEVDDDEVDLEDVDHSNLR